jgi:predicted ATPase
MPPDRPRSRQKSTRARRPTSSGRSSAPGPAPLLTTRMSGTVSSAGDTRDFELEPGPGTWIPLTSFVGRQSELADLEEMVAADRLVTLLGPGGTGKTRLALALRDRLASETATDVHVVELASLREARLVPAAIAQGLGVRGPPDRSAMDLVVERLSEGQHLLILDNLEQLKGIATPVRELLGRCPSLRILATSRRPLRISGERRYKVDPLDTPNAQERSPEMLAMVESVALFVERAAVIDREFKLTADNAEAVAAVCRRVDGLPLAIELAAARVDLLSPSALMGRLDVRLSVLTGGAEDAPRRQATLRDTIAWSYELLGTAEAAMFEQASVFVGGFTEAAASVVLRQPDVAASVDLLGLLGSLVEHSLMLVKPDSDGEPRFGMLETIREFAADQLADPGPVTARHAAFFLTFAEAAETAIESPEQALWARRLAADIDNVRAALEWA